MKTAIAAAIAAASLVYAWNLGRETAGLDFYQFWAGAQVARWDSTTNLYSPQTRASAYDTFLRRAYSESDDMLTIARLRSEFEFFSTPFLYTTFGVFRGDYDRDLFAYRIVSLAAFAAGVTLIARAVGLSWPPALLLLAFTLTLFQPLKSEVRVANVNSLQLLAVGGAMWLAGGRERWRWFTGAMLLALVAMFKPNIALVVPLLLVYRWLESRAREHAGAWMERRMVVEAAGAAAGMLLAFAVSSIYFGGTSAWSQWFAAARDLASTMLPLESGNVAPFVSLLGARATLVVTVVLTGLVLYFTRERDRAAIVIGLGLLIYLVAATLVWMHYLILALPLAIALTATRLRWPALLALTLVGGDLWTTLFRVTTPQGEAVILWLGLAILFILGVRALAVPELAPTRSARQRRS